MKKINETYGKTILVVHTGLVHKRFIFPKLKKMGLKVIVLHFKKTSVDPYVDNWIFADLNNHNEAIEAVNRFISENKDIKIDGVLTFWEDCVLLTSKIADRFNFIGIPYNIALKVRNKFNFRTFCKIHNIKSPMFSLLNKEINIDEAVKSLNFPVVVKPIFGSSGAYVIKAEDETEFKEVYNYIKNNISSNIESALSDGFDILVEEYIDGDEVDIDMLIQNGKVKFWSISDNFQTNEPFFIETGQTIPTTLPEKNQKELVELAEEVLEKLGIMNGVIHFEAKSTENGAVPIEVNLRMGGDEVYSFVKGAWGVDLVENAIKIALGIYIKINKPETPKKYIAGEYFLSDYSGILSQLEIDERIKNNKYLEEISIDKKVGDPVLAPPEGYEYIGWFTASGLNNKDAEDNMEEIKKLIHMRVARYDDESMIGKTERKNNYSAAVIKKKNIIGSAKIEKIRYIDSSDIRNLHVGIACNTYTQETGNIEAQLTDVGNNIEKTLKNLGYRVTFFDFNNLPKVFNDLRESNVDLVFNVCERINNSSLLEPHAASVFDTLQIPYTGSNPFTLALCIDKIRVKKLLNYHNIPTAKWDYIYTLDDEISDELKFPLIVKPANTDNSIGVDFNSVVVNQEELKRQLKIVVKDMGRPALIEEYIEGDEYDVSIMGDEEDELRILPLSRSVFDKMPKGMWHIYTNEIKFGERRPKDFGIVEERPPKGLNKNLSSLISEIALDTYNILDCHDYGRVELRVDKNGNPYVLELNPNPSINIGDCIPSVAALVGMDYGEFLEEIIKMTLRRYRNKPPYYHLQSNLI